MPLANVVVEHNKFLSSTDRAFCVWQRRDKIGDFTPNHFRKREHSNEEECTQIRKEITWRY